MKTVLFSICIPVRNDLRNLKQCLSEFRKQDLSDCEIIVCDDGSTPSLSGDDLQDIGIEFRMIRQVGKGPSAARNHLARVANGDYLFFVDADTVPQPHLIQVARSIIAAEPQIQVFYGAYDDDPAHRTLVSSYKNLLHHYTHVHSAGGKERITTFWCGCGVIRRELYLEFGGLSEFYNKPSIEDIELGSRLSAQGVSIRIVPELQVKHLKQWTLRNWLYTDAFLRGIPWVRLMRAKKDWTSQLNFSWSQRTASLAALTFTVCVPLSVAKPVFALPGLTALALFLGLNLPFIDLVRRKRGLMVSLAVVPLHMIYALVCVASIGAAFLYPPLKLPSAPVLHSLAGKGATIPGNLGKGKFLV